MMCSSRGGLSGLLYGSQLFAKAANQIPNRLESPHAVPDRPRIRRHGTLLPRHRGLSGAGHASIDLRPASGQNFGKEHTGNYRLAGTAEQFSGKPTQRVKNLVDQAPLCGITKGGD